MLNLGQRYYDTRLAMAIVSRAAHIPNINKVQWNFINMNTVEVKHFVNTNHFAIPRHYNTNTASYC